MVLFLIMTSIASIDSITARKSKPSLRLAIVITYSMLGQWLPYHQTKVLFWLFFLFELQNGIRVSSKFFGSGAWAKSYKLAVRYAYTHFGVAMVTCRRLWLIMDSEFQGHVGLHAVCTSGDISWRQKVKWRTRGKLQQAQCNRICVQIVAFE